MIGVEPGRRRGGVGDSGDNYSTLMLRDYKLMSRRGITSDESPDADDAPRCRDAMIKITRVGAAAGG